GLRGRELGQRALELLRGAGLAGPSVVHLLLETLQLGPALQRPAAAPAIQEHGAVRPAQRLAAVQYLVPREQRLHPRGGRAVHPSPTRSRASSASASRRAVSWASASSVRRRALRPCASCSLSSATRRRTSSRACAA